MSELRIERCCVCDLPTDKSGKNEDSLYLDNGGGPYCRVCYGPSRREELEVENARLQTVIDKLLEALKSIIGHLGTVLNERAMDQSMVVSIARTAIEAAEAAKKSK